MVNTVLLGLFTGVLGFFPGAFLSVFLRKTISRTHAFLMGATGGLLLAFICFEILEVSFLAKNGIAISIAGILTGAVFSLALEGGIPKAISKLVSGEALLPIKTGIMIALASAVHNIPEGIAIGSMHMTSPRAAAILAVIVGLHCLPESLAVFIPIRKAGARPLVMLLTASLPCLTIVAGSLIGGVFSHISSSVSALMLSFAGGVMLFTACGHIFPEPGKIWNGRMSAFGAVIGFILGVLISV